jgi:hypothetical protein
MLKFFIDESGLGKHMAEKVCSVAGFVASNSAWNQFQQNWGELLDEYGVTEFHAKEFWMRRPDGHLAGMYQNWQFSQARSFIADIINLIAACQPWLVGASIKLEDYFSYSADQRRYLTGAMYQTSNSVFRSTGKPGSAYFVPFQVVVIKSMELGVEEREDCHFVFDEQKEFEPLALKRLAEMKANPEHKRLALIWGDTVFSSSSRVLPLQTADLAAFCCKEYYKQKMYSLPFNLHEERSVPSPLDVFKSLLQRLVPHKVRLFKLEKDEMDRLLAHSTLPTDDAVI